MRQQTTKVQLNRVPVATLHIQAFGSAKSKGVFWLQPHEALFNVHAQQADAVVLTIFSADGSQLLGEFTLKDPEYRTGDIWHVVLSGLPNSFAYGYLVHRGESFTSEHHLIDPYAKRVLPRRVGDAGFYHPLGLADYEDAFDWKKDLRPHLPLEQLIIYETHVGGFTRDSSSGVKHPGTFLGMAEKVGYLVELGVNAVELMPLCVFDPLEAARCSTAAHQTLGNYWGYSPINYFAPAPHYGSGRAPGCEVEECKEMIRVLHAHGIEVIIDVVYNHTGEGDHRGPTYSFRGFADEIYYMKDSQGRYMNFSGCGNTLNVNHPIVRELIIDSLRYWVTEMHVDGFRFDLGSILARDRYGHVLPRSPVLEAITDDPLFADIKLIAEPWDAVGLYQVGSFYPMGRRWSEWNDRYRDCMRKFINGDAGVRGEFATRLCGSEDLYGGNGTPRNSVNFITAHDGFTLADLVSYSHKYNLANGEGNRDGTNNGYSWNCGAEGETDDASVLARRSRQIRNFFLTLLVSRGVPMFYMGDEYGHSKNGNNNTFCLDDKRNWFQWDTIDQRADFFRFVRLLLKFRKSHPLFQQAQFYSEKDIHWHGLRPDKAHWGEPSHYLAFTLRDQDTGSAFYIAFNTGYEAAKFTLPQVPDGKCWKRVIDTAEPPPLDFLEAAERQGVPHDTFLLSGHSSILLEAGF